MMTRQLSWLDRCLMQFDRGVRTLAGVAVAARPSPAQHLPEADLTAAQARHSAGLMRVNHAGEVSAQGLYHAQALTARSASVRTQMELSATEENDHLAWCGQRLQELHAHPSYFTWFWYGGSFAIGVIAGWAGDDWSLGFVAETERQVVQHLDAHLQRLPESDQKSYAILSQMREDELHHATVALTAGARELPLLVRVMMRGMSKVMTKTAYWC